MLWTSPRKPVPTHHYTLETPDEVQQRKSGGEQYVQQHAGTQYSLGEEFMVHAPSDVITVRHDE